MHGVYIKSSTTKKGEKGEKRVIVPRKFFDVQYNFDFRKASSQFEKLAAKEKEQF